MLNWFKKKSKDTKEVAETQDKTEAIKGIEQIEEIQEIEEIVEDEISEEITEDFQQKIDEYQSTITEEIVNETLEIEEKMNEPFENTESKKLSFFDKLKNGLTKTRNDMSDKIGGILSSYKKVDEELFDDLEEVLVTADVGVNTTMKIIEGLRNTIKTLKISNPSDVKELLKDEIKKLMKESVKDNELIVEPLPAVILVVGVNGVGKTTTIGKLSIVLNRMGKKF